MQAIENNQSKPDVQVLDSIEIKKQKILTVIIRIRLGFKIVKGMNNSCILKGILFDIY